MRGRLKAIKGRGFFQRDEEELPTAFQEKEQSGQIAQQSWEGIRSGRKAIVMSSRKESVMRRGERGKLLVRGEISVRRLRKGCSGKGNRVGGAGSTSSKKKRFGFKLRSS